MHTTRQEAKARSRWSFLSRTGDPKTTKQQTPSPSEVLVNFPNFDDHMPQPAEDASIRSSWNLLKNLINSHSEEFYQTEHAVLSEETIRDDIDYYLVPVEGSQEARELATLLYWPICRNMGLRITIAKVVLASINFYGDPYETSLDYDVIQLLRKFQQNHPSSTLVDEVALSKWRIITAYLLSPTEKTPKHEKPLKDQIPCVETLTDMLRKFAKQPSGEGRAEEDRIRSLEKIATQATEFGQKLFTHPATWIIQWGPAKLVQSSKQGSEATDQTVRKSVKEEGRPIALFPALLRSDGRSNKQKGIAIMVDEAEIITAYDKPPAAKKQDTAPVTKLHMGDSKLFGEIKEPPEQEDSRSATRRTFDQPHYPQSEATGDRTRHISDPTPRTNSGNEYIGERPLPDRRRPTRRRRKYRSRSRER